MDFRLVSISVGFRAVAVNIELPFVGVKDVNSRSRPRFSADTSRRERNVYPWGVAGGL